jgi:hypothetical protein
MTVKQQLIDRIPDTVTHGIIVVPLGTGTFRCTWYGMSPGDVARALYEMADKIAVERCPPINFPKG